MEHGFVKPEAEVNGWLDELLIAEFHKAGLWLPEEIAAWERQLEAQAGMTFNIPANQLSGHFGQQGIGQLFNQGLGGAAGGGLGPFFGGLFGGLR